MKKHIFFLFIFFASLISVMAQSDGIPERPNPPRLVNNLSIEFPNFLSKSEEHALEQKLETFANETSNQIVVVIVDDIADYEVWDYATRLGHKWGVGQSKEDNGIVVLIKPTGGEGNRKASIYVGYGLEGAIPDLTAKRIIENEFVPNLKAKQYYVALDKVTDVLMALAKGEYSSDAYGAKHKKKNGGIKTILMIIVFVIFIIISIKRGGRGGGNGFTIGAASMFMGGGRGFGGGSSGGGFGGFGGGGFGGGGASGNW